MHHDENDGKHESDFAASQQKLVRMTHLEKEVIDGIKLLGARHREAVARANFTTSVLWTIIFLFIARSAWGQYNDGTRTVAELIFAYFCTGMAILQAMAVIVAYNRWKTIR